MHAGNRRAFASAIQRRVMTQRGRLLQTCIVYLIRNSLDYTSWDRFATLAVAVIGHRLRLLGANRIA